MQAMFESGRSQRCGRCANCLSTTHLPCLPLAAIKEWDEQLGGVSAQVVRALAATIRERGPLKLKCGTCKPCRHRSGGRRCAVITALLNDSLPLRLRWAVPGAVVPAGWAQPAAASDIDSQQSGDSTGDDGSGEDDEDEDEPERWLEWVPYVNHTAPGAKAAVPRAIPRPLQSAAAAAAAAAAGAPAAALTAWLCCARSAPPGGDANAQPEECGHSNTSTTLTCQACGAPRWDGPVGQLRARVVAVLQSGGLGAAAPQAGAGTGLAQPIAARILWECGTEASLVQGVDGGGEAALVEAVAGELPAALCFMQQRAEQSEGQELDAATRAACITASRTQLGKVRRYLQLLSLVDCLFQWLGFPDYTSMK